MHALLLIALACADTGLLRRLIRQQLNPVRACYSRALSAEVPDFGGKLVLKFVIGPGGTVSEAEITQSALKSETFEACVVGAVKAWRFPKVPGGGSITVVYPILFKQAAEALRRSDRTGAQAGFATGSGFVGGAGDR